MGWRQSTFLSFQMTPSALCRLAFGLVLLVTNLQDRICHLLGWMSTQSSNFYKPCLNDWRHVIMDMSADVSQLDGATTHYACSVHCCLDATFPQHWIRWGGTISGPPWSHDLTPLNLFLWAHIKTVMYEIPIKAAEELNARIMGVFQVVQTTLGCCTDYINQCCIDVTCTMILAGSILNTFRINLTVCCSRFMTRFN